MCVGVCMRKCPFMCAYDSMHVCVLVCMCVCVFVHARAFVCLCFCVHMHMYVPLCVYFRTHLCTPLLFQERERAESVGYEDPINPTYEATTEMYHMVMEEVMRQINLRERGKIAVMVASHNENTVREAVRL